MGWRRVDDMFDVHPKIEVLRSFGKRRFSRAIALWTLAGCHACRSDDGTFHGSILPRLGVEAPEQAIEDLIQVGLLERVYEGSYSASCGPAYRFHDWLDYNESPEEKAARRKANRERQRRLRARRNAVTNAPPIPTRPDPILYSTATNLPSRVNGGSTGNPPPRGIELPASAEVEPVLAGAYAAAYEAATGDAWMSWAAAAREIAEVARWVNATATKSGEDPRELAARWMTAAWAKCGGRVPKWEFLARDPASYFRESSPPSRTRLTPEGRANRIGELKAKAEHLRTKAERFERQGKPEKAQPLWDRMNEIGRERRALEDYG